MLLVSRNNNTRLWAFSVFTIGALTMNLLQWSGRQSLLATYRQQQEMDMAVWTTRDDVRVNHTLTKPLTTTTTAADHDDAASVSDIDEPIVSLDLHELPGYTGWARPSSTLANCFYTVTDDASSVVTVGTNYTLRIHCPYHHRHKQTINSQGYTSLFYIRAYGPAILNGEVFDWGNGTFDISVLPWDAGEYTLDVVLTFSRVSTKVWSQLPLRNTDNEQEPAYEGHQLPNVPRSFRVVKPTFATETRSLANITASSPTSLTTKPKPHICQTKNLIEEWPGQARLTGRWKVVQRFLIQPYSPSQRLDTFTTTNRTENNSTNTTTATASGWSLEGYQNGTNSIGFSAEYVRSNDTGTPCRLLAFDEISSPSLFRQARLASSLMKPTSNNDDTNSTIVPPNYFHVVFVGDSNMKAQSELFRRLFLGRQLKITRISTNKGLVRVWDQIQEAVANLTDLNNNHQLHSTTSDPSTGGTRRQHRFIVLFNSGMHDIFRLCHSDMKVDRNDYLNETQLQMPCVETYHEYLSRLTDLLCDQLQPLFMVWQSTMAGWPKWGNVGMQWPATHAQRLTTSSHAVEHWNEVARSIMKKRQIPVMDDSYWLSLSRPDHRECTNDNDRGNKMAHSGPQVYEVLVQMWASMVLESMARS